LVDPKVFELGETWLKDFALVDRLLRRQDQFFDEISRCVGLAEKIQAMLVSSCVFMAAYGALLGSTHSLRQSLSSAAKLPLVCLVTLLICAPALYTFGVLFGANQRLSQSVALVLAAISVTGLLLFALAPVAFFFGLTTPDSYQAFKLLNVFFFAVAGCSGAACLNRGLKAISTRTPGRAAKPHWPVFCLWLLLYGFVGSQMAWTLRPFVGYPSAPFELFRQIGGNVYTDILASAGEILGFIIVR
jgi:sorbitol-specific phosphotransferase system component IIC